MVRLGDFNATSVPDPLNSIATLVSGVADEHFRKSDLILSGSVRFGCTCNSRRFGRLR